MNKTNLELALDARFTDMDEVRDISNHGISGGFSGFIYSTELAEFYDEHSEDIDDEMNNLELTPNDIVSDVDCWTLQELKEKSVWIAVECYCHSRMDLNELIPA